MCFKDGNQIVTLVMLSLPMMSQYNQHRYWQQLTQFMWMKDMKWFVFILWYQVQNDECLVKFKFSYVKYKENEKVKIQDHQKSIITMSFNFIWSFNFAYCFYGTSAWLKSNNIFTGERKFRKKNNVSSSIAVVGSLSLQPSWTYNFIMWSLVFCELPVCSS